MVLLEGDLELYVFLLMNFLKRICFLKRISLIVILSCCILVIWFYCSFAALVPHQVRYMRAPWLPRQSRGVVSTV
jgi:hypothetical protein